MVTWDGNSTDTVEKVGQFPKVNLLHDPPIPQVSSQAQKYYPPQDFYKHVFTATSTVIAPNWKELKCPSIGE